MIEQPLATVFGTVGVVYGLIAPIVLVAIISFFLIAGLSVPGASPGKIARAVHCYLMMGFGILLMTISAIPTVTSVLAGTSYLSSTYIGLLIVFAVGGCVFLWHDNWAESLDSNSRAVPSLIFLFAVKTIGSFLVILSGLSIVLTLVLGGAESGWWIMPVTLLIYGFVLFMSTQSEKGPKPAFLCGACFKKPRLPCIKPRLPRLPGLKKTSMSIAFRSAKTKKGKNRK